MKNYTIRIVNAKTGNCLFKHTFQKENQIEAMSAFMASVQVDTEEGDVFFYYSEEGIMAVKPSEIEEIEYYLIYG